MKLTLKTNTTIMAALLGILGLAPQAMQATNTPVIQSAAINSTATQITIIGTGFTGGGNPTVKLDGFVLTVISQTPTFILANLPNRLTNATYALSVTSGGTGKFSVATDFRFGINTSGGVAGTGATCTLGQATLYAGPVGNGLPAQGQLLQISAEQALYDLIGTTFGGDGVTTFALPDLRPVAPDGLTYYLCDLGVFPSGR